MAAKELPVLMGDRNILKLPNGSEIKAGSSEWVAWLGNRQSFRYESQFGNVTVRPGKGGWYAYKKAHGKLYSAFLSTQSELTTSKLEAVAGELIRKGEENKPVAAPVRQSEMEELKVQVSRLEEQLKVVTEELKILNEKLGKRAA